jgi:glutaredoxin-like protein
MKLEIQMTESAMKFTKDLFQTMEDEVELKIFTTTHHCLLCNQLNEVAELVAGFSPKIKITRCECDVDSPEAKKYGIDKHPAIVIHGRKAFNIRYFGLPVGLEYGGLIETIVEASKGTPEVHPTTIEKISKITEPVHIQVFVTPTCPYCPQQVRLAHKLAMINQYITADMVEAMEFQDLAIKYNVFGVPKTIVNEELQLEGIIPEPMFVQKLLEFLGISE